MITGPNSIALSPEEVNKNAPKKHDYLPLLCPFRKRTYFMVSNSGEFNTYAEKEEEFLPCIKERCMRFNRVTGCGI